MWPFRIYSSDEANRILISLAALLETQRMKSQFRTNGRDLGPRSHYLRCSSLGWQIARRKRSRLIHCAGKIRVL
jgi:hypothetical protein